MEEQLSLAEAKRLSLLKWKSIAKYGDENHIPKECNELNFSCGFCERWNYGHTMKKENCNQCEFGKAAGICVVYGSLWSEFSQLREIEFVYDLYTENIELIAKEAINENYSVFHVMYEDLLEAFKLGYNYPKV